MNNSYQNLLENLPTEVCDFTQQYRFLTERHIQAIWLEQKYFKGLTTTAGENIKVISPGIWNGDAGPDFLKAHIKVGSREFLGDVEIHLNAESWKQHGHHDDQRYDNVILHVSLWKPNETIAIVTKCGRVVLQTSLDNCLTVSPARILKLVDLDLYPYKKFLGSGRCSQSIFKSLPSDKIAGFFKKAALWRLEQKRKYLAEHIPEASLLLGAGIAMALGYKNNAEIFLDLYALLVQKEKKDSDFNFAYCLKACGYFNETYRIKWETSEYYQRLLLISNSIDNTPKYDLKLNQIRPLNNPVRRLFFLSQLVADANLKLYFQKLESCWSSSWPYCKEKKDWSNLCKEFHSLLPHYEDTYWMNHFSFENEPQRKKMAIVGQDLKNQIIINTSLPLLLERILSRGHSEELGAFNSFFESIPMLNSGKTKYLKHRFFGDSSKGSVLKNANIEQGTYQLHKDFCVHFEASCEGCPFEERFVKYSP